MENFLVDAELQNESVVAFVHSEKELREVIASEADGLIVIDGRIEISSGEPLELFEEQCLAGNNRVHKTGVSELVFRNQKSFNILKLADKSGVSDLKIVVTLDDFAPQDALFELKGCQEVKFRNLELAVINHSGRILENVSIVYLDNGALLDCENIVRMDICGHKVKAFELANNSRLNIRGMVDFISDGRENYVLWLYNGATVNIFSKSVLRADYADTAVCGNGGIFNSDSTVNIFGGASVYLAGDKIMVNEFDTMGGFFVYKNAEISIRGMMSEKADTWKCTRFWRQQEASGISSLDVFGGEFKKLEKSEAVESV